MKTLVRNNISLYLFEDDKIIFLESDKVTVGYPTEYIIADCNKFNSVIHENVNAPEDWEVSKYLFNGSQWIQNLDWVDPTANT